MSGAGEDSAEKPFEPTERRLQEARRKGEVPRSQDLTTAAAYGGFVLAIAVAGPGVIVSLGTLGIGVFDRAEALAPVLLSGGQAVAGGLLAGVGVALVPLAFLPAIAAASCVFAQRGWVFAPSKLAPKLSRVSPIAQAKQKFGRDGLFEFAKSAAKLVLISAVLWAYLSMRLPRVLGTIHLDPGVASAELGAFIIEFALLVVVTLALIGAADLLWQRHSHLRRNRMSHKEMRDEMKQSEGDPHMKSQRRQRGQEIATNRMMAEVPKADVVIVNPTHYAVVLRWDRGAGSAPVCVAKGCDAVAARIREAAMAAGVPIQRDPPTARALHATVELGQEILPEHYRAVAAAIRFAEAMRARARRRWTQA